MYKNVVTVQNENGLKTTLNFLRQNQKLVKKDMEEKSLEIVFILGKTGHVKQHSQGLWIGFNC